MSWLLPSKRSASVFLPLGESKTQFFSTLTQGSWRRSAAMASRSRVSCFSRASSFLRATSHSSRDTTFGLSTVRVDILIAPFIWVGNFFHLAFLARQFHGQCRKPSDG